VLAFNEKRPCARGLINSGIYILERTRMNWNGLGSHFSWEHDVLEPRVGREKIGATVAPGAFIDIGVPDDYNRAQIAIPEWIR
jgi:D-glycero-alpha-D-manno-heptose 1-phosphate guanylyltransferase